MSRVKLVSIFFVIFGLGACTQNVETATNEDEGQQPAAEGETNEPAAVAEPTSVESAYLTFVTGLRREPTDAKRVDDPKNGQKKVSNWVMTLYRGEQVAVLEVKEGWARVRASDDSEGWIKKSGLLPAEGVTLATVLDEIKTFNRPDLIALNSSRTLEAGKLLFALKTKDQFTEVNYYGQGQTWVLSEKLVNDSNEIAAAKLLAKFRWLKDRKDPDADGVLELARSQFGATRVVNLAEENDRPEDDQKNAPDAVDAKKDEASAGKKTAE